MHGPMPLHERRVPPMHTVGPLGRADSPLEDPLLASPLPCAGTDVNFRVAGDVEVVTQVPDPPPGLAWNEVWTERQRTSGTHPGVEGGIAHLWRPFGAYQSQPV